MSHWRGWVIAVTLAVICLAGCGASTRRFGTVQTRVAAVVRPPSGTPIRIAVIVMENEEYGQIIGSPATPYINGLARRYALARANFAISHPSLPNYLALTGGASFGITSDCTDCTVGGRGLGEQLSQARIPWRAYMEGLPHACFTAGAAGLYAKKHDPFLYYRSRAATQCRHVVPMTRLTADERAGALARFVWITPNLCHDMHDCSPAQGDRFLARLVPPLLRSLGPHGLLFLTWDEGSSDQGCCRFAAGGHVAEIIAGGGARRGARLATPSDHYSTLQAIEDLLGLPRLRGAACPCTPSLAPLLAASHRRSGSARAAPHHRGRTRTRQRTTK